MPTVNHTALDQGRLDRLFQYALAVAAQADDFRQRDLGPIHLLKYAYLADLAHAQRHEGATFTGTVWQFHNFGPWSVEAFSRIAASVTSVGADTRSLRSTFSDDAVRYRLDAVEGEHLARRLERDLPGEVTSAICRAVQQHGADTADLLRHVYLTAPMLNAKPGTALDFTTVVSPPGATPSSEPEVAAKLTAKEKRVRKSILESALAEIQRRLRQRALTRAVPSPAPRYDAVFFEGTAQLDRAAGEPVTPSSGELRFDDSVWFSSQRREPGIS